jgi:hypothetical protein
VKMRRAGDRKGSWVRYSSGGRLGWSCRGSPRAAWQAGQLRPAAARSPGRCCPAGRMGQKRKHLVQEVAGFFEGTLGTWLSLENIQWWNTVSHTLK